MVRQATRKLTPVHGTWNLDADDRAHSYWREIEETVRQGHESRNHEIRFGRYPRSHFSREVVKVLLRIYSPRLRGQDFTSRMAKFIWVHV